MQLAAEALISALDKTPRVNWEQTIGMALQSMKDVGYAEGYRVGSFALEKEQEKVQPSNDTGLEDGLAAAAGMVSNGSHAVPINQGQGEDKALANDKPTEEEALEDVGHEILRVMARQIALTAKTLGVGAKDVQVSSYKTNDPGAQGHVARLVFDFRNVQF